MLIDSCYSGIDRNLMLIHLLFCCFENHYHVLQISHTKNVTFFFFIQAVILSCLTWSSFLWGTILLPYLNRSEYYVIGYMIKQKRATDLISESIAILCTTHLQSKNRTRDLKPMKFVWQAVCHHWMWAYFHRSYFSSVSLLT